jgi:hypothetical protein
MLCVIVGTVRSTITAKIVMIMIHGEKMHRWYMRVRSADVILVKYDFVCDVGKVYMIADIVTTVSDVQTVLDAWDCATNRIVSSTSNIPKKSMKAW